MELRDIKISISDGIRMRALVSYFHLRSYVPSFFPSWITFHIWPLLTWCFHIMNTMSIAVIIAIVVAVAVRLRLPLSLFVFFYVEWLIRHILNCWIFVIVLCNVPSDNASHSLHNELCLVFDRVIDCDNDCHFDSVVDSGGFRGGAPSVRPPCNPNLCTYSH